MDSEIVMASLWSKYKKQSYKKKHTLRSLGVGFAFFGVLYIITKLSGVSVCPVKNLFGFSCFGCGLTRGFVSILHFDFRSAIKYNILSVPLFFAIALYCAFAVIDFLWDKNFIKIVEKQLAKRYMFFVYLFVLLISALFNAAHQ